MFLKDGNVRLRPIEKEDAEFLRDCINHPDVIKWLGIAPEPKNIDQEEEWIETKTSNENEVSFMIEYKDETVGEIALIDIHKYYRRARFGFLMHPDYHGKGIGTKSLQMLLDYGFNQLNLHKIEGGHYEGNEASRRVQEKLGFQEEGRKRDEKFVDGEYKDLVLMSILEDEWKNRERSE